MVKAHYMNTMSSLTAIEIPCFITTTVKDEKISLLISLITAKDLGLQISTDINLGNLWFKVKQHVVTPIIDSDFSHYTFYRVSEQTVLYSRGIDTIIDNLSKSWNVRDRKRSGQVYYFPFKVTVRRDNVTGIEHEDYEGDNAVRFLMSLKKYMPQ